MRAAAQLGATHRGAVVRHVRHLEAALDAALFEGPNHRLALTPAGRALLGDPTAGFSSRRSISCRAGSTMPPGAAAAIRQDGRFDGGSRRGRRTPPRAAPLLQRPSAAISRW
ncbi:MAG: LysR family transcriptional regulator [Acetobacteraceae bacterium]|nr:LysR family transcriptional regulator [Acetobacteraceae bacterium]